MHEYMLTKERPLGPNAAAFFPMSTACPTYVQASVVRPPRYCCSLHTHSLHLAKTLDELKRSRTIVSRGEEPGYCSKTLDSEMASGSQTRTLTRNSIRFAPLCPPTSMGNSKFTTVMGAGKIAIQRLKKVLSSIFGQSWTGEELF